MGGDKTGIFNQTETSVQTCCAVVFCSKDCRRKATQGYHRFREPLIMISRSTCLRYECEMRLYELLPMEGKDMFGYFLALRLEDEHLSCLFVFIDILFGNRAITQRNLDYFLDHQQMFEVIKFNLI